MTSFSTCLSAVMIVVLGLAPAAEAAPGASSLTRDEALKDILDAAFPDSSVARPETGPELFLAVVSSKAFEHATIGPFDLYAYRKDGLSGRQAKKMLDDAVTGLTPAAELVAKRFPEQPGVTGVIAGRRFPLVFVSSEPDSQETGFAEVVALLDRCEDLGYSGWKPYLPVWGPEQLLRGTSTTWDVKVFNLAHQDLKQNGRDFAKHGLGYMALSHLIDRLFAKGLYGPVPPWLRQGLVDELDIEAYGNAWVAAGESSSWRSQTAGWSRQGWEGFLPTGAAPPPPVMGPPPNLPTSYQTTVTTDSWMSRNNSTTRHWSELAGDRKSDIPAAFRLMAGTQTYAPRDRAYSRCVLHLLIELAPPDGAGLLPNLDSASKERVKGVLDGDPLPVAFARALGGVPAVDEMEELTLQQQLTAVNRTDILERIHALKADAMLEIGDHRAQGEWLYHQLEYSPEDRQWLFNMIAEVEALQELREWEVLGAKLDQAADAALRASSSYPKASKVAQKVVEAFRGALKS